MHKLLQDSMTNAIYAEDILEYIGQLASEKYLVTTKQLHARLRQVNGNEFWLTDLAKDDLKFRNMLVAINVWVWMWFSDYIYDIMKVFCW